jgi:hypothetical protein
MKQTILWLVCTIRKLVTDVLSHHLINSLNYILAFNLRMLLLGFVFRFDSSATTLLHTILHQTPDTIGKVSDGPVNRNSGARLEA